MSKNNILYVKGMNISDSEQDNEEEDIWDDSKLNDAYDKALRIANAEVAKRLAMSTNSSSKDDSKSKGKVNAKSSQKKDKIQWKAGMHCRALYDGDGLEYEALFIRAVNDKECVVRFLGYENSEIVSIASLKPSLGKSEWKQQIEDSLVDKLEVKSETIQNNLPNNDNMECSDRPLSPGSSVSFQRKKKSGKKKNKQKPMNGFEFPDMPMPDLDQLRNLGAIDMPIPPPPLGLRSGVDNEEQAVSSMLISWYMSGYYTGLYHGMKRYNIMKLNSVPIVVQNLPLAKY